MTPPTWHLIHATALCFKGMGFLLLGKSRSGKSDFALRLIIEEGARLVGDDACEVAWCYGGAFVRGTLPLSSLLEVRPWGVKSLKEHQTTPQASLAFACVLDESAAFSLLLKEKGIDIPVYPFDPFEVSACAKLKLLVQKAQDFQAPLPSYLPLSTRVKSPL
ncbi:MAG: hypothetical protein H2057_04490 [Alphaproteobacteria bacterium]|nr:hypothetical protein [Alphaproteobacteria bacterium]